MKAAIILHSDSPTLGQAMAELSCLLAGLDGVLKKLELWIIYCADQPTTIPHIVFPFAAIHLLKIEPPAIPEAILQALLPMQASRQMDVFLFPGDGLGQELCTRLAYRLDGSSAVNVGVCSVVEGKIAVQRQVYGNNLIAEFRLAVGPYCISVAKKAVHPVTMINLVAEAVEITTSKPLELNWLKTWEMRPDDVASELAGAEIVLALGNGVQNRENLRRLQSVADTLGAEIGVSRPVAMSGWAGMNQLIGVSGHLLTPRICIAAGVSGSAVFSIGIESSEFLVAINNDRQAAIFNIADVGIVDDLFAVLFELEKILKNAKKADHCPQATNRSSWT